jgi:hypothetical protein
VQSNHIRSMSAVMRKLGGWPSSTPDIPQRTEPSGTTHPFPSLARPLTLAYARRTARLSPPYMQLNRGWGLFFTIQLGYFSVALGPVAACETQIRAPFLLSH